MKVKTKISISDISGGACSGIIGCDDVEKFETIIGVYLDKAKILPEDVRCCEISLSLAAPAQIAEINAEYRDINEPTDVLSFPMWEGENGGFEPPDGWETLPLGDIIVCPEVVENNALENGRSAERETALVICHGFLHLIGFDHAEEEEKEIMWMTQDGLVSDYMKCVSDGFSAAMLDDGMREKLMACAEKARESAYAPYSGFSVGAALLFENGEIVAGCNVENSSYGLSICAERNAMTTAVSLGMMKPIAVAIAGPGESPCMPCGACRQFLAEFNDQMSVVVKACDGGVYSLKDLLPGTFRLEDR